MYQNENDDGGTVVTHRDFQTSNFFLLEKTLVRPWFLKSILAVINVFSDLFFPRFSQLDY